VSPKELARAEEGPKGVHQLKEQRYSPKQFSLPREPNMQSTPQTAHGTPMQFQLFKWASPHMIAHDERLKKSKPMQLLREVYSELEGMTTWAIPQKCEAPHAQDCARRKNCTNKKLWIKNRMFRAKSIAITKVPH